MINNTKYTHSLVLLDQFQLFCVKNKRKREIHGLFLKKKALIFIAVSKYMPYSTLMKSTNDQFNFLFIDKIENVILLLSEFDSSIHNTLCYLNSLAPDISKNSKTSRYSVDVFSCGQSHSVDTLWITRKTNM